MLAGKSYTKERSALQMGRDSRETASGVIGEWELFYETDQSRETRTIIRLL
jgi:hypothetical protein